jgi:hypothetical protein
MNRQLTFYLTACVIFLGICILLIDRSSWFQNKPYAHRPPRVLQIEPRDIMQVRVIRDFWNTFTVKQNQDGNWDLIEPSLMPANFGQITRLIDALANLSILDTIGSITDDSERYREYGLWDPSAQVTVTSAEHEWKLAFGLETTDGQGVYVIRSDNDEVYVIPKEAFAIIVTEAENYTQSPTNGSARNTEALPANDQTESQGFHD